MARPLFRVPPATESAHNRIDVFPGSAISRNMATLTPDQIILPRRNSKADTLREIARLRRFAWMMDAAVRVPGTQFRFGIDTVLGLFPVGGDVAAGLLSLVIVWRAHRLGVSKPVLARMAMNIGIEVLVGAVPVLGDAFDTVFKANLRNIALMERALGIVR